MILPLVTKYLFLGEVNETFQLVRNTVFNFDVEMQNWKLLTIKVYNVVYLISMVPELNDPWICQQV